MAYFPFFVDIAGKKGLIVGGGTVALRKAEKLLPYGPALTVAAPELLPEFASLPGLTLLSRPFAPELLEEMYFVIAASDDAPVNRQAAALCRERGILVNVADDREACSFLFPSLVREGPLSVGISTGGASPSGAVWVKEQIRGLLPEGFAGILEWLESVRPAVKEALPDQKDRETAYARLFAACLSLERPLQERELAELWEEFVPQNSSKRETVDKI